MLQSKSFPLGCIFIFGNYISFSCPILLSSSFLLYITFLFQMLNCAPQPLFFYSISPAFLAYTEQLLSLSLYSSLQIFSQGVYCSYVLLLHLKLFCSPFAISLFLHAPVICLHAIFWLLPWLRSQPDTLHSNSLKLWSYLKFPCPLLPEENSMHIQPCFKALMLLPECSCLSYALCQKCKEPLHHAVYQEINLVSTGCLLEKGHVSSSPI